MYKKNHRQFSICIINCRDNPKDGKNSNGANHHKNASKQIEQWLQNNIRFCFVLLIPCVKMINKMFSNYSNEHKKCRHYCKQ